MKRLIIIFLLGLVAVSSYAQRRKNPAKQLHKSPGNQPGYTLVSDENGELQHVLLDTAITTITSFTSSDSAFIVTPNGDTLFVGNTTHITNQYGGSHTVIFADSSGVDANVPCFPSIAEIDSFNMAQPNPVVNGFIYFNCSDDSLNAVTYEYYVNSDTNVIVWDAPLGDSIWIRRQFLPSSIFPIPEYPSDSIVLEFARNRPGGLLPATILVQGEGALPMHQTFDVPSAAWFFDGVKMTRLQDFPRKVEIPSVAFADPDNPTVTEVYTWIGPNPIWLGNDWEIHHIGNGTVENPQHIFGVRADVDPANGDIYVLKEPATSSGDDVSTFADGTELLPNEKLVSPDSLYTIQQLIDLMQDSTLALSVKQDNPATDYSTFIPKFSSTNEISTSSIEVVETSSTEHYQLSAGGLVNSFGIVPAAVTMLYGQNIIPKAGGVVNPATNGVNSVFSHWSQNIGYPGYSIYTTATPVSTSTNILSNLYLRFRVLPGGNVGIGESSPSEKLHVSGNARITGAIYDSSNSAGSLGQHLESTGTGIAWADDPIGCEETFTQTAHGFVVGDIVYWNGSAWTNVVGNFSSVSGIVHIIYSVEDANTFTIFRCDIVDTDFSLAEGLWYATNTGLSQTPSEPEIIVLEVHGTTSTMHPQQPYSGLNLFTITTTEGANQIGDGETFVLKADSVIMNAKNIGGATATKLDSAITRLQNGSSYVVADGTPDDIVPTAEHYTVVVNTSTNEETQDLPDPALLYENVIVTVKQIGSATNAVMVTTVSGGSVIYDTSSTSTTSVIPIGGGAKDYQCINIGGTYYWVVI